MMGKLKSNSYASEASRAGKAFRGASIFCKLTCVKAETRPVSARMTA